MAAPKIVYARDKGVTFDNSGDNTPRVMEAVLDAGPDGVVVYDPGTVRCVERHDPANGYAGRGFKATPEPVNVIDHEDVLCQGAGLRATKFIFAKDHGPGTYEISFQKDDPGNFKHASAVFGGAADVTFQGPGAGSVWGKSSTLMGGARFGNAPLVERVQSNGSYFGAELFRDHETLRDCIFSGLYGIYLNNGESAGDQNWENVKLDGCLKACVGIATDGMLGGATLTRCQLGGSPFSFFKEGGEFPVRDVGLLNVKFEVCSFENALAFFLAEKYLYGGKSVGGGSLRFDNCFGNGFFKSGRMIAPAEGAGSYPLRDGRISGYPIDAAIMGMAVRGLSLVPNTQPFVAAGKPTLALLAVSAGGVENLDLGEVGGLVRYAKANGTRLFALTTAIGPVSEISLKFDSAEGTMRRAATPFADGDFVEYTDGGERVRKATGATPFVGVAVEGASGMTEAAVIVTRTEPSGKPVKANVAPENAAAFDAVGRYVAVKDGMAVVTASRQDAVGWTTGLPSGGKVPLRLAV